jgi:RNA 3'-terminal phosphate cyclase (ATP)
MLTIDGSAGEGGGQIVRSSVALSLVTGKPVVIDRVRAGRKKPGLKRQHLAAVLAAADICGGRVEGADIGSERLEFYPGQVVAGEYTFRVGTAGSATLVLQTVLPALLVAKGPSRLTLEGGTHNPWAPPFDFLDRAYLPLVSRMGPNVTAELERPGFFPAGGGRFRVNVQPAPSWRGFSLIERGRLLERRVRAVVAGLPRHIAERECEWIARKSRWPAKCFQVDELPESYGPGNVVMVELGSQYVTELFTGFGQRGVRAEQVANAVWTAVRAYLKSSAPVGPHLADQLLLPLGICAYLGGGGGTFRTMRLTRHSTTHIEILRQFLDVKVHVETRNRDECCVRIG